jgi:hypothetical protein
VVGGLCQPCAPAVPSSGAAARSRLLTSSAIMKISERVLPSAAAMSAAMDHLGRTRDISSDKARGGGLVKGAPETGRPEPGP